MWKIIMLLFNTCSYFSIFTHSLILKSLNVCFYCRLQTSNFFFSYLDAFKYKVSLNISTSANSHSFFQLYLDDIYMDNFVKFSTRSWDKSWSFQFSASWKITKLTELPGFPTSYIESMRRAEGRRAEGYGFRCFDHLTALPADCLEMAQVEPLDKLMILFFPVTIEPK